jgi:MarR family transcriptional regulator, lower aerobic nicotinate degradation pathway regulator
MDNMDESVIPLIEQWEKFKKQKPDGNLEDFAKWILAPITNGKKPGPATKKPPLAMKRMSAGNPERVAVLITRLQKWLAGAVKPSIKELGFTKEHEYNFLYQIWKLGETNKNDLSKENGVEFSTGRDIIKRLVGRKLVSEKQDPVDKRASLVKLTPKGLKILEKSFEKLVIPFRDYLGDLNGGEQALLITILSRLNDYHENKSGRNTL